MQPGQVAEPCRFAPIVALSGALDSDPGRAPPFAMEVTSHGEAHVRLTCAIGALINEHHTRPGLRPIAVMLPLSHDELERLEITSVTTALDSAGVAPDLLMIRVPRFSAGARVPALERATAAGLTVVVGSLIVRPDEIRLLPGAPVDMMELPGSLVDDVDRSIDSADRVEHLLGIAHRIDWLVLARNVRRPSQAKVLQRLGCDLAAGPLMGAPVEPSYFGAGSGGAGGERRTSRLAG